MLKTVDPSLSCGPYVLTMRVGMQKICTLSSTRLSMGTTIYDDKMIIRVVLLYIYIYAAKDD